MKDFLTGVGLATAGLAVFSGSVVGILALQGRLDSTGVFPATENQSGSSKNSGTAVEATAKKQDGTGSEPRSGSRAEQLTAGGAPVEQGPDLFPKRPFDAPTDTEELARMAYDTKQQSQLVEQKRAALQQEIYEHQLRKQDLLDREKSVEAKMREVQKAQAELDRLYQRFKQDITILEEAKKKNIKRQAESLQAQDPQVAADTMLKYLPENEDLAVQLLVSMEAEVAAKVLEKMDTAQAAHLIERATRVIERKAGQ